MARFKKGLLGGITGVIGNLEGYMLNGQLVLRTRRAKSTKPPTAGQLASRHKMRVVSKFLGSMIGFVNTGFAYVARGKDYSAHNAAIRWQLKNAVLGEYPDFTIDYASVRVTEGPIDTQGIDAAATIDGNKLIFTWKPNRSYAHANDCVMLLAYAPALNEAVYTHCGAKRSTGTDQLTLPVERWGEGIEVETYLSFIAENGIKCTNSIYTGRLLLE
jgi:hypothetical protein